jgi:hypothetical protein
MRHIADQVGQHRDDDAKAHHIQHHGQKDEIDRMV